MDNKVAELQKAPPEAKLLEYSHSDGRVSPEGSQPSEQSEGPTCQSTLSVCRTGTILQRCLPGGKPVDAKDEVDAESTLLNDLKDSSLFPQVLYHVLNECSEKDFTQTGIRWTHDGLQIQIGRLQFVNNTLGKYFNTGKYNSFTRNLNLYGFKKCKIYCGIYSHPNYQRGNFSLIKNMRRPKVAAPGKGEKRGRPSLGGDRAQTVGKKPKSQGWLNLPKKPPPTRPSLQASLLSPQTPEHHQPQAINSPCASFHEKASKRDSDHRSDTNIVDFELSMQDAAIILSSVCRDAAFSSILPPRHCNNISPDRLI